MPSYRVFLVVVGIVWPVASVQPEDVWDLREPNDAPPGVCCAQQNGFLDALGRLVRFPAFSGRHGWQSFREVWLKNSSARTYDPAANQWRAMRPCPEIWPSPLRGATYDPRHQAIVIRGGEGARHSTVVYGLYANRWQKDPIVRLTPEPIRGTEFLDRQAGERTRRYEIVAVDAIGQEGGPSRSVWSRREWQRFYVPYAT